MYAKGTTCRLTIGVTAKKKKKSGLGRSLNKKGGTIFQKGQKKKYKADLRKIIA